MCIGMTRKTALDKICCSFIAKINSLLLFHMDLQLFHGALQQFLPSASSWHLMRGMME